MSETEADVGGTFTRRSAPRWQAPAPLSTEELFRILVESVEGYAILMLDAEGRVVSWNRGAQRITDYERDEVLGRHFSIFFAPEQVNAGQPAHELECAARDGRYEEERS